MAGGAAGGFVTRAFESMLKECSGKKHPELQKAIQNYIGYASFQFESDNVDFFECIFLFAIEIRGGCY